MMKQEHYLFISLVGVMLGFGLLMVHSASVTSWPTEFERVYLSRHAVFLLIGILAAGVCAWFPARFWFYAAPYLYMGTVLLLIAVIVPGVGSRINGAQRWLRYGPISIQPSELAKLTLPMLICAITLRRSARGRGLFSSTVLPLLPILVVIPMVITQPDLGTALFLIGVSGMTLFLAGWPIRNFVLTALTVVPLAGFLFSVKPYQLQRITGFLAAWADMNQAPYQMKQSLVTLGSGGLFGVGLGRGWQKLSFLPEANTDFVFAVVGEELGLVGAVGVVVLWSSIYVVGLHLLKDIVFNSFARVAGTVLLTQITLQAALNVAVVTAMVPPKGIPHPLLSYGGSSLVASLVSFGIVISLSRAQNGLDDVVLGLEMSKNSIRES